MNPYIKLLIRAISLSIIGVGLGGIVINSSPLATLVLLILGTGTLLTTIGK